MIISFVYSYWRCRCQRIKKSKGLVFCVYGSFQLVQPCILKILGAVLSTSFDSKKRGPQP